jgi:transcriptional regulator with XRE-family HTH domain
VEQPGPDFRRAASQILRALRGRRSQLAFSRRLGYRSNVACDWEAGRRLPTAHDCLRACSRLRVDVAAAFQAFQPACAGALRDGKSLRVDRWLNELRGSTPVSQLAERTGFSRYALGRWFQGRAQPRLHDFLALVEAISGRASDLVGSLVPIEAVPELYAVHAQRVARRRLAFDAPWSEAVLRVLESSGQGANARHPRGYIARRLGIDQEQERAILQQLEDAGILRVSSTGELDVSPLSVDTSAASAEDVQRIKAHWAAVALERTRAPRPGDWLGYNLVSTSRADLERIRDILRRAFREIRALAAASQPAEAAALLNLQLVTWDDLEPEPTSDFKRAIRGRA